jgi:hypothetical protein
MGWVNLRHQQSSWNAVTLAPACTPALPGDASLRSSMTKKENSPFHGILGIQSIVIYGDRAPGW